MLTQEQIQNLKPGDPLIINGTFVDLDDEGDIEIKISYRLNSREIKDSVYGSPSCVSLPSEHGTFLSRRSSAGAETEVPTPKYDPTRLFREGDEVRVVEKDGRTPTCFPVGKIKVGDILTVIENEGGDAFINVKTEDGSKMMAPWFHIELVTPVEELERYAVDPGDIAWFIVDRKHESGELNVAMYMNTHPNAKAAAKAECARLNAEYRKEQNNG